MIIQRYIKFKVITAIAVLFLMNLVYVQAQTCISPTVLSFGTPVNNLTTCGKGDNFNEDDACGNDRMNGLEYVFNYTPSLLGVDDCVTIQLSTSTSYYGRGLFIFDGCPDLPGTNCLGQATPVQTNMGCSISNLKLEVGRTYKIVVSAVSGCHPFNIAVVAGSCNPSPPVGSTCGNPTNIPSVPYSLGSQTTCGFGNDYNEGNIPNWTGTYLSGDDYVFKYTPSDTINVEIKLANTGAYTGLFVIKGCPSDPNSTYVNSNVSSSTVSPSLPLVTLNGGETYYILVSTNGLFAPCGSFDFSINEAAVNSCQNPEIINFGSTATNRTTCGVGDKYDQQDACGNRYMNGEDYVFKYTTTSSNDTCINIDMTGPPYAPGLPVSGIDRSIFVFDGCPDNPATNCIAQGTLGNNSSIKDLQLKSNKDYYIIASSTGDCYGPFNLAITAGACIPKGPGTSCEKSIKVTLPYNEIGLTTCNSYNDYNAGNVTMNGTYINGEDYVIEYTPAANECIGITLKNVLNGTGLFILNGCPDEPNEDVIASVYATSNVNGNTTLSIPYVSLGAGKTYYIIVSSNPTTAPCTAFDISIVNVACCGAGSTCYSARPILALPYNHLAGTTCGTCKDYNPAMACGSYYVDNEDYVYSYTPPNDECIVVRLPTATSFYASINIFDGCPGDASTNCVASNGGEEWNKKLVAMLEGGKEYFIVLSATSYATCYTYDLSIETLAPGQPGQNCSNPYPVPALPFTRTGMSTACSDNDYVKDDYYTATACTGQTWSTKDGEDFVFEYISPGNEIINVTAKNVNADPWKVEGGSLYVTYGCPGSPGSVCVGVDDDSGPDPSLCYVSLTNPGAYYFIIDTYKGFTPFDITIEKPPVNSCVSPLPIASLPFVKKDVSTKCLGDKFKPNSKCGGAAMNGEDIIYAYTSLGNEKIRINLTKTQSNTGVYVFDGCPSDLLTNCIASAVNTNPYICTANLVNPGTYYIVVDRTTTFTNFDIEIIKIDPTGFTCATPIIVNSLPYYKEDLTTQCFANDYAMNTTCVGTAMNGEDVVYSYTPIENEVVNVRLSGTSTNTGIFITKGCPSAPSATCIASARAQDPTLCQVSLTGGDTYYFIVDHTTGLTKYNIAIEPIDKRGTSCANPFPITSLPFTKKNGTTRCFLNDHQPNGVCGAAALNAMNGEDFVYAYTATGPQNINIRVTRTNGSIGLYVLDQCPGTNPLNCLASVIAVNPFLCNVAIPAAGTYYIMIDRTSLYTDFDITIGESNDAGVNFANPFSVTIPYEGKNLTTACYGNDYDGSDACNNTNIKGNDFVFKFSLPATKCMRITGKNFSRVGGFIITNGDPNNILTTCMGQANCTVATGCAEVFTEVSLPAGTYYVVVGSDDALGANLNFDMSIKESNYDATIDYAFPSFCKKDAPARLSAVNNGGVWSGPGIIDATKGIFDPAIAGDGVHKIKYAMGGGFCIGSDVDSILITVNDNLCDIEFCNFGLSRGNFDGWQGFTGVCCPVNATNAIIAPGRQEIMTKFDSDPFIGTTITSTNHPFCAKLGNNGTGAQAERLVYEFPVTQPYVGFNYAVVLQDPGHAPVQQPRFEVSITDEAGLLINCGYVSFVPGTNTPGFITQGDVKYKEWSAAVFDMTPYIGQKLTFDFKTGDCSQGAHYGYAFIDGICDQVITVDRFCVGADSVKVTAPPGYYEYLWSNGSTKASTVFYDPKDGDLISVVLTPSPGLGCPVQVPITLVSHGLMSDAGIDNKICEGESNILSGSITKPGTTIWTSTGTGTFDDSGSLSTKYTPSAADISAGNVKTYLKVSDFYCTYVDSTMLAITKLPAINVNSITICEGETATLTATGGSVYNWVTGETVNPITVSPTSSTTYKVTGTASDCSNTAIANVTVNPNSKIALTSALGTDAQLICVNSAATDITYAISGGGTGGTVSGLPAGLSGTFSAGEFKITGTPTVLGEFDYTINTSGTCNQTSTNGKIIVSPDAAIALTSEAKSDVQTLCINTSLTDITYAITGGGTGGNVGGLPAGLSGTYAGGVFSITGTPVELGTFIYTVNTTGVCKQTLATGSIKVNPDAAIALTSAIETDEQVVCINKEISSIVYAVSGGGTGAYASSLPTGVSGSYLNGEFTITGTPNTTGIFDYIIRTTGTCEQTEALGKITVNPDAAIALFSPLGTDSQIVCINKSIDLISYSITAGGTGGNVSGLPNGLTGAYAVGGIFNIIGTPTQAGTFQYTVNTTGTCEQKNAKGLIIVNPLPPSPVPTNNSPICEGEPLNLSTTMLTGASYAWTGPNNFNSIEQNPNFSSASTALNGVYSVTATLNNCASQPGTTLVTIQPAPEAPIVTSNSPICEGKPLNLTASNIAGATYSWKGPNSFISSEQNPGILAAYAAASGTYIVELIVDKCKVESAVEVNVSYCDEVTPEVYPPTGFSPNADGTNDVYLPYTKNLKSYKLFIFNRWGEQIFESNETQIGWDGMFKGEPVEQNIYVYLIQAIGNNDKKFSLTGTVMVMR